MRKTFAVTLLAMVLLCFAGGIYALDLVGSTRVVAAYNSLDTTRADYVCNGTDDQVQIQSAIDNLGATGGRVILLEGQFNITAPIRIGRNENTYDLPIEEVEGITLEGQGTGTKLAPVGSNVTPAMIHVCGKYIPPAPPIPAYYGSWAWEEINFHTTIKNMQLGVSDYAADTTLLRLDYSKGAVLQDLLIFGGQDSMYLSASQGYFANIEIRGAMTRSAVITGDDLFFYKLMITGAASDNAAYIVAGSARFIGCIFDGARYGGGGGTPDGVIIDSSDDLSFVGCSFTGNDFCGVRLRSGAHDIRFMTCTFSNNSRYSAGTYDGAYIDGYDITFTDCLIHDYTDGSHPSHTQRYGICEGSTAGKNIISGNKFRDNVSGAVYLSTSNAIVHCNDGFMTRAGGTASVANGGTIAHGLSVTPRKYQVTSCVGGHIATVTSVNGANLAVGLHSVGNNGAVAIASAENVSWYAEY